jgi:hypothetical protein
MAAGLGFKDFTTGEVLTAADVDGYLMQGIWVFASAAARDAAVTSPQEGNACYLKDTNEVLTYSGSAWVAVGGGSPLTTKGDLYTYSTVDARLGVGTNGQILTADSTAATGLKWAAPAGGGKVLQVVNAQTSTLASSGSSTYIDTGLTATITPSSASSKILVLVNQNGLDKNTANANNRIGIKLLRGGTVIQTIGELFLFTGTALELYGTTVSTSYLDSPATTSATTYKTQFANTNNTADVFVQANSQHTSTITLLEIGA